MAQFIIQVLLRGIQRVTKSRDSALATVLCCLACATVLMFTSTAGAYTYTYTDGVFTGSFRVSGTAVDPDTGLINTHPNSDYLQAYTLVDGNWGPWSNTSALTVDSYSFTGRGYTFSMAVDHPAPNSVGLYVNHQGQIVDWSWTIYDGAWPNDTVAQLVLYGGPHNVGNTNPRPDQENLYIFKPSYVPVRYTNTGTWTGSADTPSLTVAPSGNGAGVITSSPSGINCGNTCNASFPSGTPVTLTPTPHPGSYFLIWSTPCSGSTLCSLTVNNSTQVTATFGLQAPTYCDTVQRVYIGYYQRPADPVGLLYWAERLAATNGNLNDIIEAYANSPESQALYGTINSTNIANVIDAIYMALFNRHAEAGGLAWYINGFDSGQYTAATIMLNVLYGAQNEDLTTLTNKLAASNLFTRTIDPQLDGLNFQVTYAGNQDASSARTFLASVTDDGTTIPTQAAMTTWMKNSIANPGDPILSQ